MQGGGPSKNPLSRHPSGCPPEFDCSGKEYLCPSPIGARSSGRESDNSFGSSISMQRLLLSNLWLHGNAPLRADFVKSEPACLPLPPPREARGRPPDRFPGEQYGSHSR